jgi:DNA polymerase-1
MAEERVLLLVDGYALIYRAFFAFPAMSGPGGEPTNALFGAIRMLRTLRDTWGATHWVVVFDGGLPAEYKAQRPSMPDALRSQVDLIEEFLELSRVAAVRMQGQEADDVLATLAVKGRQDAGSVLVATGDKDLFQVVDEVIRVVPVAGKGAAMGPEDVVAKTGVRPGQVVDWLALVGDTADNIAGVPGIGPKTAAALLTAHGSIEGVYAALEEVRSARTRTALQEHADTVERNRRMVRLNLSLAVEPDWTGWEVSRAPAEGLLAFYRRHGLKAFAQEMEMPDLFTC